MTAKPSPTRLQRLWLCETLRLREEHAGPLEDGEANRHARRQGGDLAGCIEARALLLAERDGQLQAQQHWLQGARLALGLLLVLALLSGAGLALAALGDGSRPVNVFWALGSLLGLHLLLLLGWALGLLLAGDHNAALGRLWLWLSEKLARDARAAQLGPALVLLLQRRRLNRWLLGLLVHGLWLVALLSAGLMLLLLLSTRRYGFVWETTLLAGDTFVALTQLLGALPALLGFPIPDAATIRASGDSALAVEAARHAWAGWLLGVLLVFGLLPRALLLLLCLWRWQHGSARLALDLGLPGYRLLGERLQPASERLGVLDAAPASLSEAQGGSTRLDSSGAVLVAIELDPQRPWPPALPKAVADAGVLDSREQRQQLLDQLVRFPPARLAIALDPRRSPDRGTLALLGELARTAAATRIWLLPPAPGETLDSERLGDWHAALQRLALPFADSAPLAWLEHGHD
ncbi:DUF2868 domain-containing protein [Pseudomonas sp. L-22-4S-12]|uniref:DUF2868 domain-containing protein n=1 Tax=Pseudomonas sp. L-22-4S-12 TaxID=2610893 RepID=UPI001322A969|nr:DUF2868 domain-containing protein [Pseudomonas sp. L-22-4S-12]MWV15084.1 DUF2868 domain-containing protein [Pseudomonas sp. L-22-4S-12]